MAATDTDTKTTERSLEVTNYSATSRTVTSRSADKTISTLHRNSEISNSKKEYMLWLVNSEKNSYSSTLKSRPYSGFRQPRQGDFFIFSLLFRQKSTANCKVEETVFLNHWLKVLTFNIELAKPALRFQHSDIVLQMLIKKDVINLTNSFGVFVLLQMQTAQISLIRFSPFFPVLNSFLLCTMKLLLNKNQILQDDMIWM